MSALALPFSSSSLTWPPPPPWLSAMLAVVVGLVLGVGGLNLVQRDAAVVVVDLDAEAEALASTGAEVVSQVSVGSTTATAIKGSSLTSSWLCQNANTQSVWRTSPGESVAGAGIGPYCSDATACPLGSTFTVAAQTVHVLASAPVQLWCSRLDGGAVHAAVSPRAGSAGGNFVLKTGDTMTGPLSVNRVDVFNFGSGTSAFLDTNGVNDFEILTAATSSGGVVVKINDSRTTLAATACDSVIELGQVSLYDKAATTSMSLCACERHAGTIGWYPMTVGGECS